jgi:asparagine synthase (glutamine-hydrolysing)
VCGIAGILLTSHMADPQRLAAITTMTASLRHRGPDGEGFWIDNQAGIALGHRRLAIVDLSEAGRQPMTSHGEALVMTYNGEIYNCATLRSELGAEDHRFNGRSDTELMLAAFESFGIEAALRRFVGMFALGLWDRRKRVLHLIRDRLGKKPLYVALVNGALLFASELRAIRAYPGFGPPLDPTALALLLCHGWIPDQHCIWEGVLKLPPGAMLSVRPDELDGASRDWLRNRMRVWWSLDKVADAGQGHTLDLEVSDLEQELDRLLRMAVRERMAADVPLGALLSGGIDSALVVSLMQVQSSAPIRTFTIGFRETCYDEADDASRVARYLGCEHTELRLTPDEARAAIPDLPRIWDEPFADESQLPTFMVSRLARQHVTVALSGDGGDESFGGYARHLVPLHLSPILRLPPSLRRMGASALLALGPNAWDWLLSRLPLSPTSRRNVGGEQIQKLARVLDAADDRELYQRLITVSQEPAILDCAAANAAATDSISVPYSLDRVGRLMYQDTAYYLPGDILVKLDRASMAVSLEARCPLLDHRIVEFAWRLPTSVKVRRGKGKWLLRRVLRRYIPESFFERPKHGFDVPIGAWLKGPLRDWAEELLASRRLCNEGLLDPSRVRACWLEHLSGRRDRSCELWAILMFESWLDVAHEPTPSGTALRTFEPDHRFVRSPVSESPSIVESSAFRL